MQSQLNAAPTEKVNACIGKMVFFPSRLYKIMCCFDFLIKFLKRVVVSYSLFCQRKILLKCNEIKCLRAETVIFGTYSAENVGAETHELLRS